MSPDDRSTPAPPIFELDHLVLASASLERGSAWLEDRLGVRPAGGGAHPGWGTHNRLLRLDQGAYLELIAPDPGQQPPARPRLFGLDDPALRALIAERPRLIHYVMRTSDLAAARALLDYDPGVAEAMSRGSLNWLLTVPPDGRLPHAGVLPSLIDWGATPHPARALPESGIELLGLAVIAPAAVLARATAALGAPRIAAETGARPGLRARLRGPAGTVTLD